MSTVSSLTDLQNKCLPAKVLAVSKLQSDESIRALYKQGQRDFAENYVQEFTAKVESLKDLNILWHFIGHLQKNKVKAVVGRVELIHSVDSMELAKILDFQAEKLGLRQKVLIQVNLANEVTKGGFSKNEIVRLWPLLVSFPHLSLNGLMTMPPLAEPGLVRPFFKELKELFMVLKSMTSSHHPFQELSMGTSGDFEVALSEGATIVRIGTILFGERPSKR